MRSWWWRSLSHAASVVLLVSGCAAPRWRTPRAVPRHDARSFFTTVSVRDASFSADETRILFTSDASGVYNVHAQPIDGGAPVMLTHSTRDACHAVSCFPADDRFLYTADQGGNELNHLYVQETDGRVRDLTPGEAGRAAPLKASFLGWTADGRSFFAQTNERDPRYFDLYRYDADSYERRRDFQNDAGWSLKGVSRDGRWLALRKVTDNADSDVYLLDLTRSAARPRLLTQHQGKAQHEFLCFTPDSAELLYTTDAFGEFAEAWSWQLESRASFPAIRAKWDVSFARYSDGGRYRAHGINADGQTEVAILDVPGKRPVTFKDLPPGELSDLTFSPSEKWCAFYVDSDTTPPNLYVANLATGVWRALTDTANPAIRPPDLVEGQTIRYASFDGLRIPAILYRPWPASAANKVPALVWVHGGPGGQSRKGYQAMIQHLVNHDYAVLAVNNRGSSGYGKTFFHLDDRKHGDVDLKDCVWARRWLERQRWIDRERIGIIGGSYGGFMVAAALAFEPGSFDVGIDIFGVTNWVRTLESIPPWWRSFRDSLYAEMGDPAQDRERLERFSPLLHAGNIRKPLLVVQGANDPRVLQVESDELVQAVRANRVPVEYVVFSDEGHGFRRRENRITASEAIVRFLDQRLRGVSEGEGDEP